MSKSIQINGVVLLYVDSILNKKLGSESMHVAVNPSNGPYSMYEWIDISMNCRISFPDLDLIKDRQVRRLLSNFFFFHLFASCYKKELTTRKDLTKQKMTWRRIVQWLFPAKLSAMIQTYIKKRKTLCKHFWLKSDIGVLWVVALQAPHCWLTC